MGPTSSYAIRPIAPADESFLWEALYHAIYVAPGDTPPERDIVNRPELARYVRDWGDVNDLGFIAVTEENRQPIGAAWIRLLTGENMGYGYTGDKSLRGKRQTLQLWLEQHGRCPICGEMLTDSTTRESSTYQGHERYAIPTRILSALSPFRRDEV